MNLSAQGHPLEPLREAMRAKRLPDAAEVRAMSDGRRTHYAGLVICRQRPGTASGVVFLTLEDETASSTSSCGRRSTSVPVLVKTVSFLGVTGKLQTENGVTHLIAETFWRPKIDTEPVPWGAGTSIEPDYTRPPLPEAHRLVADLPSRRTESVASCVGNRSGVQERPGGEARGSLIASILFFDIRVILASTAAAVGWMLSHSFMFLWLQRDPEQGRGQAPGVPVANPGMPMPVPMP